METRKNNQSRRGKPSPAMLLSCCGIGFLSFPLIGGLDWFGGRDSFKSRAMKYTSYPLALGHDIMA